MGRSAPNPLRALLRRVAPAASVLLLDFVVLPVLATGGGRSGEFRPPVRPTVSIPRVDKAPALADFLGMRPENGFEGKLLKIDQFTQNTPKDGEPASQRTEAYLGYDDKHLYVIFVAFDTEPQAIRARMSRRENIDDDDLVQVMLDTFSDERRAYSFIANPLGIQQDRLWAEGQNPDVSFDTLWYSEGRLTDEGYVVWMAIPFRSLRFPTNGNRWGIVLQRIIQRANEYSYWPHVSSRIAGRLNQEAKVEGLENISPGRNIQLIPYGVFRSFRALDQRDASTPFFHSKTLEADIGLDTKFVIKDRLVLDLTVNPDFSQVESDEPQTTVNQRFEVYFPEKRPFFLENSSFFVTPIDLLFTRRIADPQFGARLTGKLGRYALGALFADDQSPGRLVPEGDPLAGRRAYFGVARVSGDIFKNSSIGMIYTERRFEREFNRVGGVDFRFKFADNWMAEGQAVTSSTRDEDGVYSAGPAYQLFAEYAGRQFIFNTFFVDTSKGFITRPGFFRRPDLRRFSNFARYEFRPEGKLLMSHGVSVFQLNLWAHDGTPLERYHELGYFFNFQRQTHLCFSANAGRERLRAGEFDGLMQDREYPTGGRGVHFQTSFFPQLTFDGQATWGRTINFSPRTGAPVSARDHFASLRVTVRPVTRLTVENRYLLSRLRVVGAEASIFNSHIVRSKWNYQLTRALSLRFIAQYNSLLVNEQFSGLQTTKSANVDFLITYLPHAGTAVYVGYNSNLQNLDPALSVVDDNLLRTRSRFINDGRTVFVKVSYLIRF